MIKLLAFDIDNTLAAINMPIKEHVVQKLLSYEDRGIKVAFVSGKPAIYISGMVRQIGLKNPIIIGENGLNIYYGCGVPPVAKIEERVNQGTERALAKLKNKIIETFGDKIWFQPNAVSVTAFPYNDQTMAELRSVVVEWFKNPFYSEHIAVYRHSDSIDFAPKDVHKGNAVRRLMKDEGIEREEAIAVGDGENDVKMFEEVGKALGVNFTSSYSVYKNFNSIDAALSYIDECIGDQ